MLLLFSVILINYIVFMIGMKRDVSLIVLYNSKKQILLQHRDRHAGVLPNKWAFFGGGIEKGETSLDAVKRETMEELRYHLKNPKFVFAKKFRDTKVYGTKYVFIEKYNPKKKIKQCEGDRLGWFYFAETKKLKMASHDRKVIDCLLNCF
jgi:8-oxo-dGTP diphosphatase